MTIVPAVMALLGRRAWALPKWLDRVMPDVDVEGEKLRHALAADSTSSPPRPVLAGVAAGIPAGPHGLGAPPVLAGGSACGGTDTAAVTPALARQHRGRTPGLSGLGRRRTRDRDAEAHAGTGAGSHAAWDSGPTGVNGAGDTKAPARRAGAQGKIGGLSKLKQRLSGGGGAAAPADTTEPKATAVKELRRKLIRKS